MLLVGALIVAVLLGGGYFAYDRFTGPGNPAGSGTSDTNASVASTEAFGSPVAVDATVVATTGAEKLAGSLFPVGCEPAQGSATGIAYVIALSGVPKGESSALASAAPLQACLVGRSAYLHDGANSLRVIIAAFDPKTQVVRLQIPAPLPAQAVRLADQAGLSLVGAIVGGTQTLTQEVSGQRQAPGSPLLDNEGHAIGIVTASGERILTGRLCSTLLSC
jgi:hypothetical protein